MNERCSYPSKFAGTSPRLLHSRQGEKKMKAYIRTLTKREECRQKLAATTWWLCSCLPVAS